MKSKKKQIRLLLTCSCGLVTLGRVEGLKRSPDYDFYIVGVDTAGDGYKLPFFDEQFKVPLGSDKNYIKIIKEILIEKKIDVIVPSSDSEIAVISKNKSMFEALGVACVCSSGLITDTSLNKAKMLLYLKEKGIPVPKFEIPKNQEDLTRAAYRLGYPRKMIVLKPALSGGGNRGLWFIKDDFSKEIMTTKGMPIISLDSLIMQFKKLSAFPEIVLMEYLSGEEYSVDALAENGKPIYVIPRVRVFPLPGLSREGLIKNNPEVSEYVKRICKAFGFDSNFNVQLKYNDNGKPLIYEINPRVSATVVANAAAGVDLFLFGILKALKIPYSKSLQFKRTRMTRFSKEFYS